MNDLKGLLLKEKRFSIHDGPGIRTVFFFKGCVLKCLWCHNPESILAKPQLGYYAHQCISCGECMDVCRAKAHSIQDGQHLFDPSCCTACGDCASACLGNALQLYGREISVEEALKTALQDLTFYRGSGGGVTLSGGEPLLQTEFALAFLEELKKESIHTAVDSCAHVAESCFEQVLPYTDLFLIDFKHSSSAEHRKLTGCGNELICENLKFLSRRNAKIEIRIPVVPGCNDSPENMENTADFLAQIRPQAVRLLPYHSLSGSKYRAINMPDTLPQVPSPGEEILSSFAGVLEKHGLTVKY